MPTLAPEVIVAARHSGIDPGLIQAVVEAEGGLDHIVRAVQCSIPAVTDIPDALTITCRSAVHALSDFVLRDADLRRMFVMYWAARWAPVGADNDPHHLNVNWPRNVLAAWLALTPSRVPQTKSPLSPT